MTFQDPAPLLRVTLLGPPVLHIDPPVFFTPERRFQLLALLAYHSGEWVERDRLAALFWPDRGNSEARRNLRKVIFKANKLLADAGLEATDYALRWSVATDLEAFRAGLEAGRPGDARSLVKGAFLEGIDDPANGTFTEWITRERSRVASLCHQAALEQLRSLDSEDAGRLARELLLADPLDEAAAVELVRAELASGHTTEAQRIYQDFANRLAEDLGVETSQALRDLFQRPHQVSGETVPTVADQPADTFIGRKLELAEASALLTRADCRFLTILGPGGIGKSRLAHQLLNATRTHFHGGAHWIELQDLVETDAMVARMALAIGLPVLDSQDPLAHVARGISSERTVFVLDNAEHLEDLGVVVDRLQLLCPSIAMMVTSRERTHCQSEWVFTLAGLAVPDADSHDFEAAASFDAMRLFDLRARAAQHGFDLERNLDATIEIVDAVGGMPLAIEIAAGWTRLLPPEEIARDLRSSIDALDLDPSSRRLPARPEHVSVRAVLEKSWNLLAPSEREALADISVFGGTFTRAAARSITRLSLTLLGSLADKSLLTAAQDGRFRLHPVVHTFAKEKLEEGPPACADLFRRHAEYFAGYLAERVQYRRSDQRILVKGLNAEYANCLQAWRYAVESDRSDLIGDMAGALWPYFESTGRVAEGIDLLRAALQRSTPGPKEARSVARVCAGLATLMIRRGEQANALAVADRGVAESERCGDAEALVECLVGRGMGLYEAGSAEPSHQAYERALAVAQQAGSRHGVAKALGNLGTTHAALGRVDEAEACYRQALSIDRELGTQYQLGADLINLGGLLARRKQPKAAQALLEEAVSHCVKCELSTLEQYARLMLGHAYVSADRLADARQQLNVALAGSRRSAQLPVELSAELILAGLDIAAHRHDEALAHIRRATRLAQDHAQPYDLVHAIATYADLLTSCGETEWAARAYRAALAENIFHPLDSQVMQGKLDALDLPDALRRSIELSPTPPHEIIERIHSQHPTIHAPDAGNSCNPFSAGKR